MGVSREVRLGDLVAAGALTISDGYRVRNDELGRNGIPFVRGGDIGDGWINTNTVDHILPELANRVRAKLAHAGDVAFITKGTVGRAGRLRPGQPTVVFAPQVAYWRVQKPDVLDSRFLFYLIRSREFQSALDGVKTHGAMVADYVSISQQLDFSFRIPSIQSQRAVGRILGTLDDKIELNRRMNETLEAMAREIFRSWFVDFEPVRAKSDGPSAGGDHATSTLLPEHLHVTPPGRVPDGWRLGRICELVELGREVVDPSEHPYELFDHFSIPAFDQGGVPKPEYGAAIKSHKLEVQANAALLSKLNPRIPRVWLPDLAAGRRGVCSTEFLPAIPRAGISREFLYGLFTSRNFLDGFTAMVTGTSGSHQRVKADYLLGMDVAIPPVSCVSRYTDVVGPVLQRVRTNVSESQTLEGVRDVLLPKLMSGEVSVGDAEEGIVAAP
jgi:type I restriction enzyme S subunit